MIIDIISEELLVIFLKLQYLLYRILVPFCNAQANRLIFLCLKLFIHVFVKGFDIMQNLICLEETPVWVVCSLVIDALNLSFQKLLVIDINDPECSPMSKAPISTLKDFILRHVTNSLIIKFSPSIVSMVFYEVEVMSSVSVSLVDANCMNMICLLLLLNLLENTIDHLLTWLYIFFYRSLLVDYIL